MEFICRNIDKSMITRLEKGLVSIIMPARNAEDTIAESMESILDQTYGNIQFIVIDDASTDKTFEIANEFSDPRLEVYQTNMNVGPYAIKNFALFNIVDGEFFTGQDADDISMPERIEEQINVMQGANNLAVGVNMQEVVPTVIFDDLPAQCKRREYTKENGTLVRNTEYSEYGPEPCITEAMSCTIPATLMVKTVDGFNLGGYDATTFFGADTDFTMRLIRTHKVKNLRPLYIRNVILGSLTTNKTTGLGSAGRVAYRNKINERIRYITEYYKEQGELPDLSLGFVMPRDLELISAGDRVRTCVGTKPLDFSDPSLYTDSLLAKGLFKSCPFDHFSTPA